MIRADVGIIQGTGLFKVPKSGGCSLWATISIKNGLSPIARFDDYLEIQLRAACV
jgi:hypothetical protein